MSIRLVKAGGQPRLSPACGHHCGIRSSAARETADLHRRSARVSPGDRNVLVERLGRGEAGVRLPSGLRERSKLTQLYLAASSLV